MRKQVSFNSIFWPNNNVLNVLLMMATDTNETDSTANAIKELHSVVVDLVMNRNVPHQKIKHEISSQSCQFYITIRAAVMVIANTLWNI